LATPSSTPMERHSTTPDLFVCCVVADGEAETGALAAGWHSNKFLNPVRDGAVLPVLHLNGYKIANPTVLARIPEDELAGLLKGYAHDPYFVAGDDPMTMHRLMAETMERVVDQIQQIQQESHSQGFSTRSRWPAIVLRTPKGWTGPKEVDGLPMEGSFRRQEIADRRVTARAYTREFGDDAPEIREWVWPH
jgi:xylulose-5-phosphate/fructose-6-phosphate phosphoketolase